MSNNTKPFKRRIFIRVDCAQKIYTCSDCGETINLGQKHYVGRWPTGTRVCEQCYAIEREKVKKTVEEMGR